MKVIKRERTFDFIIGEQRTYNVQGNGRTVFEAQQDAMDRFHRLTKSREIVVDTVGKPYFIKGV